MPLVGQPVRIGKAAVCCTQQECALVHGLRKRRNAAAVMQRERDGGVISRAQHEPIQQFLHRIFIPRLQIDARALHARSLRGDRDLIFERAVLQNDECRHDLGRAGVCERERGIFCMQNAARRDLYDAFPLRRLFRPCSFDAVSEHKTRDKADAGEESKELIPHCPHA